MDGEGLPDRARPSGGREGEGNAIGGREGEDRLSHGGSQRGRR